MFNKEYQIEQIRQGKRLDQLIDCADKCVFGFLKRLINIFAIVMCVSLLYMCYLIASEEPPLDRYEQDAARDVNSIYYLFRHNRNLVKNLKKGNNMLN